MVGAFALRWLLPLAALAGAVPASAEVTGQNQNGFATGGTISIAAAPDRVWEALVKPARWWNQEHSWSGNAENLSLDARAGGCFCEALPSGGSVEHMRVIYADRGKQLRMSGALGPLQGEGLGATLSVKLEAAGKGTKLSWSYKVGGYTDLPLAQIAPAVDGVVSEQFQRLGALLEKGSPRVR
jgi:uncharacterized protein YndB with AHSA1/START domain